MQMLHRQIAASSEKSLVVYGGVCEDTSESANELQTIKNRISFLIH
jgi:hypothetical protein